ncbi:MAG: HlyD family efflux transporter periplasmic adaptor subunit [Oscillospiraceae bacterium]|nr:HlyD family efflux transporter periplasmic adaptor subunit [Oscillospiraceae bacterium]
MAEVIDQEKTAEQSPAVSEAAGTPAASGFSESAPPKKKRKKNKKKIIRRIISLIIIAALGVGGYFGWKHFSKPKEVASEVLRETVSRGSITSMVNGSGAAVAKDSESVTLISGGLVREVFVSEGDYVTAGTPLFEIDSKDLEQAVKTARESVSAAANTLSERQTELDKYLAKPTESDVKAEYAGLLLDVQKRYVGDDVSEKEVFARLVDNTKLALTLYFSYVYENDIYVGQKAAVSVPVMMTSLPGEVSEIHKVERVTPEGGRMFEVTVLVDNPGALTEGMIASATVSSGGDTIYPYESGKFEYSRFTEIKAPMTGKLTAFNARDYQRVAAGEAIGHIKMDTEECEETIKSLKMRIEDAQTALEAAQKALDKELKNMDTLSGVAKIDGTVLSVGIYAGEEAKAGTVAVSIADTSTMKVEAMLDEMYVSYAKPGMMVNIKLWENELYGVIDSVSLSAKAENGVARFPMVITVDNSEGLIMTGAYVDYSFTASQSDDCLLVPIQCVKSAQTTTGETVKVLFVETDVPPENPVELDMSMMQIPEGFFPVVVETGIADSNNIEILSGVEEDTTVYAGVVESMGGGGGMGFYF